MEDQAALLLSRARAALEMYPSPEVLESAQRALDICRSRGGEVGRTGAHDALRVIISYHRQLAGQELRKPMEALQLAARELASCREQGDRRGEAMLMLSLAEINMDKRGRGKRMEALEAATEALQIFQDLKDGENEALTQLILTNLHFKLQQPDKAQQAADAALELSTSPLLRGKALHAAALALAARRRFGAAADKAEEARLCFHEAGRLEMEAAELVSVASWRLEALQPLPALSAAEAALRSFRGLSYGKGWPQKALSVLCEALAALGQAPRAVKLTKELRQEFLEAQDLRAVAQLDELQGFLWAQSPRPERAHEPLEAARQTAQTLKEEGWHARICQGQAASFLAGGDATEALQALGRAREAAKAATDRREEAKSLRQIFQLHFDLRNFEEAIHAAEKARKVAKSSEDTAGEARDCLRMATALANLGRVDAALAKAAEARELADPRGEAQALRTLVELLRMQGNVEKAMEAAEERLTVTRNLGDLSWEAESLQQLAELHLAEGAVEEAALLAEEARKLCKEARDRQQLVRALLVSVEVALQQALETKTARRQLVRWSAEALALAGKLGDKALRALALHWHGHVLGAVGRPHAGLSFVREAAALCGEDLSGAARCWVLLAQLQGAASARQEAIEAAQEAQRLARACGDLAAEQAAASFEESMMKKPEPERPRQTERPEAPSPEPSAAPEETTAVAQPGAKSLDAAQVGRQLLELVKELTSATEEVELDMAFVDAGMDSLSSVSLVTALNRDFDMGFTPSIMFDYPTIRMLQDYLVEESQS